MKSTKWIPLALWQKWTPAERAEVSTYYETIGQRWALDLSEVPTDLQTEYEKDFDEERTGETR